jgi:hypothetical protein
MLLRIGLRKYIDRYRKTFLRIIERRTTRQIKPKALTSPPGVCIILYNHSLKELIGFASDRKEFASDTCFKVSCFLKIKSKKGLSNPREITEKSADKILKLK